MIKILITSVGSLVGQNILDVLESRRNYVKIIGMNSVAENHRNFRCDTVYLVPPTNQTLVFTKAFDKIFQKEQPDIVFAGRDIDVVFLAKYKEAHPETGNRIPEGNSSIAQIIYDKYESHLFAKENKLPFADTFLFRDKRDAKNLNKFIAKHGFPLVVKPRQGFGSLNVFFLTDQSKIDMIFEKGEEVLIQEYLCPDENFDKYIEEYERGLPLFFQIPEDKHYVSHIVISPDKEVLGRLSTRHNLVGGKAESTTLFKNKEIDFLVDKYVDTLISVGWKGSLNIQYKPDKDGNWKVFEMNSRMVGATSARLLLGFDEIALLINSFLPEFEFPNISQHYKQKGTILKYLKDHFVKEADVAELSKKKKWQKEY